MYKMVVFDLDGTLLQSDYNISEKSKKAIRTLKEKGVFVTLATGRPNELVKEYVAELELHDHVITCNGSVIYNHSTKNVLYSKALKQEMLEEIFYFAKQNEIDILLYGKDFIASSFNERYQFFVKRNKELKEELRGNFILAYENEEKVLGSAINKILFIEKDPKKYNLLLELLAQYDEISVTRSKEDFIDIGPLGISKGDAVKKLALHHGIIGKEVIVFGDQYNDVAMFEVSGLSIAMGNAIDDVKKEADIVTFSNEQDGIYHSIQEILKKGQF